jgi:hypothetical protein
VVSNSELLNLIEALRIHGAEITVTMDEEARASEGRDLIATVTVAGVRGIGPYPMAPIAAAEAMRAALASIADYENKLDGKRERLEDRADRLQREANAAYKSGMDRLKVIPFGQPILVGHYSENRDRNYRRKAIAAVDKGIELNKTAQATAARAEAIGTGGISSDDPTAVAQLKIKLDNLEREQKRMTAINAAWRKAGKPKADNLEAWSKVADAIGMNVNDLGKVRQAMASDFLDRAPFTYHLTNNNGNMKRIKDRIAGLERVATAETKETELPGGVRMVENVEANRVQLFFPGKPSAEVRTLLKRSGFRWSPSEGAWQRHLNGGGVWRARQVLEDIARLP